MIVLALSSACDSQSDTRYLSASTMESILLDYHLSSEEDLAGVLEAHRVDRADFDSAMVYYTRHPDELHSIYCRLSDKIANIAKQQGMDNRMELLTTDMDLSKDTTDIWPWERTVLFTPYTPYCILNYTIDNDSIFEPGDKLMMSWDAMFVHQSGARNGYAVMSVRFMNDSVTTRTKNFSSNNHNVMELTDMKRVGIKEIKGYFMHRLPANKQERENKDLRLLYLRNISLVRMHTPAPEPELPPDTLATATTDSLDRDKPKPHLLER